MSWLTGGASALSNAPFIKNLITNPAKGQTVQNTNQGVAPNITQTNFNPGMQAGAAAFGQSQQNIGNIGAGLQNLSGQQAGVAQNIGNIAGQQAALGQQAQGYAGDIAGLSGQQAGVLQGQQALQGQQQGLYGDQQNLAQALLAQSQGQGPNPAQAQYMQNLNLATQAGAGTIASQKGISPALAAQLVANQQGGAYQNAAGQSAVLQAQQQIAAQQNLMAQQQAQANNLSGQGQVLNSQSNTIQGIGSLYGQAGNQLSNANSIYGAAGAQYGNQASTLGEAGTSLGQAGNLYSNQGSLANQYYNTNVQGQGQQNAAITQGSLGAQGISGSAAQQNANQTQATNASMWNTIGGSAMGAVSPKAATGAGAIAGEYKGGAIGYDDGGLVDTISKVLPFALALMRAGGEVPGKAQVKGDDPKNDKVPAMLSAGEIVLPRSVTQSPDAAEKAAEFVAKLKGKSSGSYGDVVQARKKVEKARAA